jgi:hypothetical protein
MSECKQHGFFSEKNDCPYCLKAQLEKAIELVDGAFEQVELYNPESDAGREWKQRWLSMAKELFVSME